MVVLYDIVLSCTVFYSFVQFWKVLYGLVWVSTGLYGPYGHGHVRSSGDM